MARTNMPDSATCQFFINLVDNASLDYRGPGPGAGYCVFAKVTEGMDVVDAMAAVKTGRKPPHSDVPIADLVVISASVVD
jgi:cyclophilin family peptidyl-prolyl cis-trans isomerase